MDLSELGEAAAFPRRSQAELLMLQARPLMVRLGVDGSFPAFYHFWVVAEIFDWLRRAFHPGT